MDFAHIASGREPYNYIRHIVFSMNVRATTCVQPQSVSEIMSDPLDCCSFRHISSPTTISSTFSFIHKCVYRWKSTSWKHCTCDYKYNKIIIILVDIICLVLYSTSKQFSTIWFQQFCRFLHFLYTWQVKDLIT